jgi:ComF family protein
MGGVRSSRLRRAVDKVGARLLDLLIPPRCVGCGERDRWLCPDCRTSLAGLPEQHCEQCALPGVPTRFCANCYRDPPPFEQLRAPLLHDGLGRDLVLGLKYRGHRHLAPVLAELVRPHTPEGLDVIVPVPLHPERLRERGFNQSGLLAEEIRAASGVKIDASVLVRTRQTAPQAGLSARERIANVRGAFRANRRLEGETVLLVDDVCTTGATLSACARTLRRAGAGRVLAVTVTRAADML